MNRNCVVQPSIGRRILFAVALACAMVWCVLYFLGRLGVQASEVGNFDREMRLISGSAKQLVDENPAPSDRALALRGLDAYIDWNSKVHGTPHGFVSFRVVGPDGVMLAKGGVGPKVWPGDQAPQGFSEHRSEGEAYRVLRTSSADGQVTIDVASSMGSREYVFDELMLSSKSFFPLLYAYPLLLVPVLLAVHGGLRPLRRLSAELSSRKPDDLSPIREQGIYQEITPLTDELNSALSRIGLLMNRERSFLADAAHELRTPLAVMAAQCDSLRSAPSESAREAALKRLDGGLMRASRLVNQLLALARLDAEVEDTRATIDIADVARDCLAMYASVAHTQGIDLSYTGPDSLVSCCARHCVESIIDNLVGNAVRYGGPGARIEVGLESISGGRVQLRVRDDGPGIPSEEVAHLFERFRRGSNAAVSGSGLGLAIVKSAARQIAARIDVSAGLDGRGVEFKLAWPANAGGEAALSA